MEGGLVQHTDPGPEGKGIGDGAPAQPLFRGGDGAVDGQGGELLCLGLRPGGEGGDDLAGGEDLPAHRAVCKPDSLAQQGLKALHELPGPAGKVGVGGSEGRREEQGVFLHDAAEKQMKFQGRNAV